MLDNATLTLLPAAAVTPLGAAGRAIAVALTSALAGRLDGGQPATEPTQSGTA